MPIASSLYASISGLNTMGNAMSALGDNVANVNTVAFKASRTLFQDVLPQSVSTASGADQVGRGVTVTTVDGLFAQGSFESSTVATDMAIGGQGFFMLRAPDSSEANMYTRAGDFRFDQEGNLVNSLGMYAQGWTVDSDTGETEGTIGDITIGKSTPPVATTTIEVIANLDSRKANEASEDRLFNNWNGTNAAAINPTDPIDSTKYEYTTAIKIYDSKGASHDISIYFDRTSEDNQWEFLITCDPTEDLRALTEREQEIYNPDTRYNYENHKGAGALMYGVIQFDTSGNLTSIEAYNVPPDGNVDPAKNDNRILLEAGDSYFSFPTNFTGASENQEIAINFGARYEGQSSTQRQVLVSDGGGRAIAAGGDVSNYITTATTWANVADSNGNTMTQGDTFIFEGYDNGSDVVTQLVYTVDLSKSVQDLLDKLESTFGCSATIDAYGRLKLSDNTAGDSSMFVTRFETISANDAVPFGGSNSVDGTWVRTAGGITSDGSTAVSEATKDLIGLMDTSSPPVAIASGDTFTFSGTAVDGTDVTVAGNNVFTVAAGDTIQDLLDFMAALYEDGDSSTASTGLVNAELDDDGYLRIIDLNKTGNLSTTIATSNSGKPWGIDGTALTLKKSYSGQINITTSKRMVVSGGRGFSTDTGDTTVITAATQWSSVYDDRALASGGPRLVYPGDSFTFKGTKRDGTSVTVSYTVPTAYTNSDGTPSTVQDLLDTLGTAFEADATIDTAGRLVLTDWVADTVSSQSNLEITSLTYTYDSANPGTPDIFGSSFEIIPADINSEDGSQWGDVVTVNFEPEALASTQYANSSTTIFQDQNGFASGFLQSVSVDVDGIITGHYSNGQVLKKAQMALANFSSLAGLRKEGGNIYTETTESGAPVTGTPGTNGLGSIAPNALEQSNVDLGTEFVKLITVQRGFQANSKIITTTDDMLNDLINIKR